MIRLLKIAMFLVLSACSVHTEVAVDALAYLDKEEQAWKLLYPEGTAVEKAAFRNRPSTVVNGMFTVADEEGFLQLYQLENPLTAVSSRKFFSIGHFLDEVTLAQEDSCSSFLVINAQGENVAALDQLVPYRFMLAHNFREGLALVMTEAGKYGFINRKGQLAIPPLYDRAYDFCGNYALVGMVNAQGKTGYQLLDRDGKVALNVQLSDVLLDTRLADGKLLFYSFTGKQYGYLDVKGRPFYLTDRIRKLSRFKEGYAVAATVVGTGIIRENGSFVVLPIFEEACVLTADCWGLKQNGKWALAWKGDWKTLRFEYEDLLAIPGANVVLVRKDESWFRMNEKGETTALPNGSGYGLDEAVTGACPEVFRRCASNWGKDRPENEGNPTDSVEQNKEKKKGEQKGAQRLAGETKHCIEEKDWKQVMMSHPFYAEARKIVSGNLDVEEAGNRQLILNYLEHLRTSYVTKDIDFLNQLFSEEALIVVGKVVQTSTKREKGYLSPQQVIYNVKSKKNYLNRLKQVFRANRKIEVNFSRFHIRKHPSVPGIYGVTLKQGYRSDLYSDEGYLFLLWDFRDRTAPLIHVRTWQPSMLNDSTSLPENEIFSIRNFNLQ